MNALFSRTARRARQVMVGCAGATLFLAGALAPTGVADAVTSTATGTLTISNPDLLPDSSSFFLNKIQTPADSYERTHSSVAVTLKNTGSGPLTVSSLATTDDFTLSSPWKLPFTLSTGSSVDLTLTFVASSGDWHAGTGTITWNNGSARTSSLKLLGWFQKYSEHGLEPHLNDLINKFGYGTVMPTAIYSRGADQAFSSDEVLSPYWTALDTSAPITLTQIAAWRGYPTGVTVSKYAKGNPAKQYPVYSGLKFDSQSAMPRNSSYARGITTFTAAGTIGLRVDNEFSDASLNDDSGDRAAGCTASKCGQHLRVFRVRTADGTLVPGSYLMAEDYSGINYDYNDNVFLMQNLKPA